MRASLAFAVALLLRRTAALEFNLGSGVQNSLGSNGGTRPHHDLDLSSLASHAREDAQSPVSCTLCEALLAQLKIAASRGDGFFVGVTTELCKRLRIQDDDVCEGSIALEGPVIAHALRDINVGSKTSVLACVAFMGLCDYPKVDAYNVSFPSPAPPFKHRPPPSGLNPLHVVHYSDIHVDPFYTEGANFNCTKPICCRDYSELDSPGNNEFPAGPNGEHYCDSPISLEESLYAAIRDIVPDAIFSIFTGDIIDHAVWNTTETQNAMNIKDGYGRMDKAGMLVYGTAGNHEASPTNSYPPTLVDNSSQWLYDVFSSMWSRWIGPEAAGTTEEFGAYSTKYPGSKLRIISLNTNLHYTQNYWLYEEPTQRDPSGQLSWLVSELDGAEKAGERVYIIGHMPMGAGDAFHDGSNYFDQIVKRYSSTIAALFFGHTHLDEFEISYTNYSHRTHETAMAMSYIAPSLTPTSGHPSFRVYTVDPVTFGVLDSTTYMANMSAAGFQTSGPVWSKYYSAKEAYGPLVDPPLASADAELSPAFWHNVTGVLEGNGTAFGEYWERKRRGWDVANECEGECREREICKLRAGRAQDNCVKPGLRMDLGRGRKGPVEDECEGSVARDTLAQMVRDPEGVVVFEMVMAEGIEREMRMGREMEEELR